MSKIRVMKIKFNKNIESRLKFSSGSVESFNWLFFIYLVNHPR